MHFGIGLENRYKLLLVFIKISKEFLYYEG